MHNSDVRSGGTRSKCDDPLIDSLADRFETEWKSGKRPMIESQLAQVSAPLLGKVLAELVRVELELRRHSGERPAISEYAARFPGHQKVLEQVFATDRAQADSAKEASTTATIAHGPPDRGATPRSVTDFSMAGEGLKVRCPHCRNPIELVATDSLQELTCPSCGSSFSLVDGDSTATYAQPVMKQLGHFELVEQLGMGAFGSVWKARDTELDRVVAIKIPRKDRLHPEETEKFFREARAAAQLRHPSIVSVHEVGREGDTVYIVSDLVRGVTLSDWLSGQTPTPREAAELCAQIADALHHAHEHGVIHRDLKPGNIMLDAEGRPHIMDFGLAKREAGEITMTVEGQVLGTPAYMSPEQARGEGHEVDRRTDIYSLGVILFQLLTGELPFRGTPRMLLHQVLNEEPRSPRSLNDRVPRDLETICLKAMAKDSSRRYDTAAALAEDLRRYLSGEPIHARPVGRIERTWRWAKRNQAIAGLAMTLFLALAIGFVGVSWQWYRAESNRNDAIRLATDERLARADSEQRRKELQAALDRELTARQREEAARAETEQQRQIAENNYRKAKSTIDEYLTKVSQSTLLEVTGMQPLREELIRSALRYYEEMATDQSNDPLVRADIAATHLRLGEIINSLGDTDAAIPHMESAAKLIRQLTAAHPDNSSWKLRLAGVLTGPRFHDRVHFEPITSIQAAIVIRELQSFYLKSSNEFPNVPGFRRDLAIGMFYEAAIATDAEGRSALSERIVELLEGLLAEERSTLHVRMMAYYSMSMAEFMTDAGKYSEGLRLSGAAMALYEELAQHRALETDDRRSIALAYLYGSLCHRGLNRTQEAREALDKCLTLLSELSRDFPHVPVINDDYGWAMAHMGQMLRELRELDKSESTLREAVRVRSAAGSPKVYVAWTIRELAWTLKDAGKHAEAVNELRRAADTYLDEQGPASHDAAWTLAQLAFLQREMGNRTDALVSFREAAGIYKQAGKDHQDNRGWALAHEGITLRDLKEFKESEDRLREAVEVRIAAGSSHGVVAWTVRELAWALRDAGNGSEAAVQLKRSAELYQKEHGTASPDAAQTLMQLGFLQRDTGNRQDAVENFRDAVDIYDRAGTEHKGSYAWALAHLGISSREIGDNQAAERHLRRAVQLREEINSIDGDAVWTHRELAQTLKRANRPADAETSFRRALEIALEELDVQRKHRPDAKIATDSAMNVVFELGNFLRENGETTKAQELYRESLPASREHHDEFFTIRLNKELIGLMQEPEHLFEAKQLCCENLRLACALRRTNASYGETWIEDSLFALAECLAALDGGSADDGDAISQDGEVANALATLFEQTEPTTRFRIYCGELWLLLNDKEKAERELQRAIADTSLDDVSKQSREVRLEVRDRALGLHEADREPVADRLLRAHVQFIDLLTDQDSTEVVLAHQELARLLLLSNRVDEAKEHDAEASGRLAQIDSDETLVALARLVWEQGVSLHKAKNRVQAAASYSQTCTIWKRLQERRALSTDELGLFARASRWWGEALIQADQQQEAVVPLEGAISLYRGLIDQAPADEESIDNLESTSESLANCLLELDRTSEAATKPWEEAIVVVTRFVDHAPDKPAERKRLAWMYNQLADMYQQQERREAAIEATTQGIKILRQLVAEYPMDALYKIDQGGLTCNRSVKLDQQAHGLRRAGYDEAIELFEKALVQEPGNDRGESFLSITTSNLADELLVLDDLAAYRQACSTVVEHTGNCTDAWSAYRIAFVCALIPNSGVEPDRLLEIARRTVTDDTGNQSFLCAFGMANFRAGRDHDALTALDMALEELNDVQDLGSHDVVARTFRALTLVRLGKLEEAQSQRDDAVALFKRLSQEKTDEGKPKLNDIDVARCRLVLREVEEALEAETTAEPASK